MTKHRGAQVSFCSLHFQFVTTGWSHPDLSIFFVYLSATKRDHLAKSNPMLLQWTLLSLAQSDWDPGTCMDLSWKMSPIMAILSLSKLHFLDLRESRCFRCQSKHLQLWFIRHLPHEEWVHGDLRSTGRSPGMGRFWGIQSHSAWNGV